MKKKSKKIIRHINIFSFITRHSWFFVLAGFVVVNLLFNYKFFWHQLIVDTSLKGGVFGETQIYEWGMNHLYKSLVAGYNPFGTTTSVFYPFGIDFTTNDYGFGFFFVFFRPFLSIHQSFYVILPLSLLAANIGMYKLLRLLRIDRSISFLIGLAYGYMTFLTVRLGHANYFAIYVFPWFYYFLLLFFKLSQRWTKTAATLGVSFIFVTTIWLNMYFFIILILSLFSMGIYMMLTNIRLVFTQIKKNYWYGLLFIFFSLVMLSPWLRVLYDIAKFDEPPQSRGWGGAIEYSSDLFGFFIPSTYNYYYGPLVKRLISNVQFARGIFENFTYPGVIILASYGFYFLFKRQIPQKINRTLRPYVIASFVFLILTLGPFLHVLGRWGLAVEGGNRIAVPLPYFIMHYVPFLANIRAPGRLIVGFIFFAYIVVAYMLSYFLRNKSLFVKYLFFIVIFIIFIIDHRYPDNITPEVTHYPYTLYKTIGQDVQDVSVLDIPFAVRDGFTYFGDINGFTTLAVGQPYHQKYSLGGYFGRVSRFKIRYYQDNPFLGFLGRVIDPDLVKSPRTDLSDLANWRVPNRELSKDVINFLDIKYIVTDDKRPYTATLSAFFAELGYENKKQDGSFSLWEREPEKIEYLDIDIGAPGDSTYLGMGWNVSEKGTRWLYGRGSVMFRVLTPRAFNLQFMAASFYRAQKVTVYVNKQRIARIRMETRMKQYSVPVPPGYVNTGINTVFFVFEKMYRPFDVMSGSTDMRYLSAKFNNVQLSEVE